MYRLCHEGEVSTGFINRGPQRFINPVETKPDGYKQLVPWSLATPSYCCGWSSPPFTVYRLFSYSSGDIASSSGQRVRSASSRAKAFTLALHLRSAKESCVALHNSLTRTRYSSNNGAGTQHRTV